MEKRKPDQPFFIDFVNEKYLPKSIPLLTGIPGQSKLTQKVIAILDQNERFTVLKTGLHSLLVDAVRKILENIIANGGTLDDSENLHFFISLKKMYLVTYSIEDGRLHEFSENPDPSLHSPWLKDLCHSLIDFLCSNKLQNLKKCPYCEKFFLATKNNPRQKYCPICSKKNHTPPDEQARRTRATREAKKKRKENEKRKKLFNDQYERFIEAGYSKKEAKKEAEKYVIEQLNVIE